MSDYPILPGEEEFREIADDLPSFCWLADHTGFIIWYNRHWYEYTGTTQEQMEGWGWTITHDPKILPNVIANWTHSIHTGEPFEQTFPILGADGIFRKFLTRASPVRVDGIIIRWLGVNIDISEQHRVADELRESEERLQILNQTLEARVEERASALKQAQDQLRQSQKMEAVGQLTGGIAHDFNNILTGISGNLELLQLRVRQERYSDLDKFFKNAQVSVQRAASLTQRLLAFSRRQTLDPKPALASVLVRDMRDLLKQTVGPEIDLTLNLSEQDIPILVDIPQLENALLNLCINGKDALPDGGSIAIEVDEVIIDSSKAVVFDIEPGTYVRISVVDDGCGMDEITASKAFDPFFTTKPMGRGTGLGLSMIYGFSRQSNGHVTITSSYETGTTVSMYLPHVLQESPVEILPPELDLSKGDLPESKGGSILLVDDEENIRYVLAEVLQEAGYTVSLAADGSEALRVLGSPKHLDLLITDVGLPNGMNGKQVADAALDMRPGLKILFITGYAEKSIMISNELEEGIELLIKPFSLQQLVERATKLIG